MLLRVPAPPPDFVGRDDELGKLDRFFVKRTVFLIYGVGGIGKTSLALAFLERPRTRRRYRPAFATCGSGDSLDALIGGIEGAIELPVPAAEVAIRATREERLLRIVDELERWPMAVVIDDLHRLPDGEAASLVRTFGRHLRNGRVIATSRRAIRVAEEERGPLVEIELSGLKPDEAAAWIQEAAAQGRRPAADAPDLARLARAHGGHPMLLRLALARVASGGSPRDLVGSGVGERLVGDVVAELGPDARRVADLLACFRRPVPRSALGEAAGGEAALATALGDLERRFLLEARGDRLAVHDLVRQALLASLDETEAAARHAACAAHLRTQLPPPGVAVDSDLATELIDHALAAGDIAGATADCDRAFPSGPGGAAVYLALIDRIVKAGGLLTPTMRLHRVSCIAWLGRAAESATELANVPDSIRADPATRFLHLVTALRVTMVQDRWTGVARLYAVIEEEARKAPREHRNGWLTAAANAARALGDLGQPRTSNRLCGRLGRTLGLRGPDIPAMIRMELGQAMMRLGHIPAARVHFREAQRQFQRDGLRYWESVELVNRAELEIMAGNFDEAQKCVERCRDLAERLGTATTPAVAARLLVARARGQYADARAASEELERPDVPLLASDAAFVQLELAAQELDLGQPGAARARIDKVVSLVRRRGGTWLWRAWYYAARVLAATGDAQRAERLLRVSAKKFELSGAVPWFCRAAGARVEILIGLGRHQEAECEAERLLALTTEYGLVPQQLIGELQLATLALRAGSLGPAAVRLEKVRTLGRTTGDQRSLLSAAELEVRLCLEAGRTSEADRAVARMREIAAAIGHQRREAEARLWRAVVLLRSGSERTAARLAQDILASAPPWDAIRAAAHRVLSGVPEGGTDPHRAACEALRAKLQGRDRTWLDGVDAALRRQGRPAYDVTTHEGRRALSEAEAGELAPADYELWLDLDRASAMVRGQAVDLARKPMTLELLALFMARAGRPMTLEEIVHGVWREPFHRLRHDSRVRKALGRLQQLLGKGHDGRTILRAESRGRFALGGVTRYCLLRRLERPSTMLNPRQEWLLGELERSGRIANRDFRRRFDVHRETARRDLRELVERGLIVRDGRGRGAGYRPSPRRGV